MKLKENYISAVIIIIAVGASVLIFYFKNWRGPAVSPGTPPKVVLAPKGSLAEGFPSELVLDTSAAIEESYSTNYDTGLSQKTAVFSSDKSIRDLFLLYRDYFIKAGWSLTEVKINPTGNAVEFYGKKRMAELSVAITKKDTGGSKISTSYLIRNK